MAQQSNEPAPDHPAGHSNQQTQENFGFDSPIDHARAILNQLSDDQTAHHRRKLARRALKASNDCLEAWVTLAESYSSFKTASACYTEAIAHAEQLLAKEIAQQRESTDKELAESLLLYTQLRAGLAKWHFLQGNTDLVIQQLNELIDFGCIDHHEVRSFLTLALIKNQQYDDAEQLIEQPSVDKSLCIAASACLIALHKALPRWQADNIQHLENELLGETTWQWLNAISQKPRQAFRLLNHLNPFFAAFMLNPRCSEIRPLAKRLAGHACDALTIAQRQQELWTKAALPLRLLAEFSWKNPQLNDILITDKPLLLTTLEHIELQRSAAEQEYLSEDVFY